MSTSNTGFHLPKGAEDWSNSAGAVLCQLPVQVSTFQKTLKTGTTPQVQFCVNFQHRLDCRNSASAVLCWGRNESPFFLRQIFGALSFIFFKIASCLNFQDNMLTGLFFSTIRTVSGSQLVREKCAAVASRMFVAGKFESVAPRCGPSSIESVAPRSGPSSIARLC